ncbi:hypothetical protein DPX16_12646 [Anabarilius grahami]|uniref:Uncharacterized protein n=1 Tax=Anabarilius grahami TaxID=495550 RepID=A0A3N0YKR5_ANAGA|nr:hypothetical protein DPX16_12646 [Anabarilius grahami]
MVLFLSVMVSDLRASGYKKTDTFPTGWHYGLCQIQARPFHSVEYEPHAGPTYASCSRPACALMIRDQLCCSIMNAPTLSLKSCKQQCGAKHRRHRKQSNTASRAEHHAEQNIKQSNTANRTALQPEQHTKQSRTSNRAALQEEQHSKQSSIASRIAQQDEQHSRHNSTAKRAAFKAEQQSKHFKHSNV